MTREQERLLGNILERLDTHFGCSPEEALEVMKEATRIQQQRVDQYEKALGV